MADAEIRVAIGADVSGLQSGMSDAVKAQETYITATGNLAAKTAVATESMRGFETQLANVAGRVVGAEAGIGMIGGAFGRAGAAAGIAGPIIAAAIPIALIIGAIKLYQDWEQSVIALTEAETASNRVLEEGSDKLLKQNETLTGMVSTGGGLARAEIELAKLSQTYKDLDSELPALSSGLTTFNKEMEEQDTWLQKVGRGWEYATAGAKGYLAGGIVGAATAVALATSKVFDVQDAEKFTSQVQRSIHSNADLANAIDRVKEKLNEVNQLAIDSAPGSAAQKTNTEAAKNLEEYYARLLQQAKDFQNQQRENAAEQKKIADDSQRDFTRALDHYFEGENEKAAHHNLVFEQIAADDQKRTNEQEKRDADADEKNLDRMKAVQAAEAKTNLANAESDTRAVEEQLRKMQAAKEAALAGHTGVPAQIINVEQARSEMSQLTGLMQQVQGTMERLKADIAATTNPDSLREYNRALEEQALLLARLKELYAKLQVEAPTAWQQTQLAIENATTQGLNTFNTSFISMLEHGMTFTHVMQRAWTELATSFIKDILKMEERFIATELRKLVIATTTAEEQAALSKAVNFQQKLDAAKTAAAQAMTTVGFPLDLVVGPLVFAAAMAFEKGGIVDGRNGQAVPIMAHAGEAVLPQRLTGMLERAANSEAGRGNAGASINVNYSPHINAISTKGMADVLREHGEMLESMFVDTLRKRNAA